LVYSDGFGQRRRGRRHFDTRGAGETEAAAVHRVATEQQTGNSERKVQK